MSISEQLFPIVMSALTLSSNKTIPTHRPFKTGCSVSTVFNFVNCQKTKHGAQAKARTVHKTPSSRHRIELCQSLSHPNQQLKYIELITKPAKECLTN